MRAVTQHRIVLRCSQVDYSVVISKSARQMRVRIGPGGVEVVQPVGVSDEEVSAFLRRNESWVSTQLERLASLRVLRRPVRQQSGENPVSWRMDPGARRVRTDTKARGNRVAWSNGEIVVRRGPKTQTPAARGLENWLERTGALGHCGLSACGDRAHRTRTGAGLRDGSAHEVGQLLISQKPVFQLAPHSRARISYSIPDCARGRASGRSGSFGEVLVDRAEPLSRHGASQAMAKPSSRRTHHKSCKRCRPVCSE